MNFFKSCCSTNDAGEPAKKEKTEEAPKTDAQAAEDKPAEGEAPADSAPVEEAPADAASGE